MYDIIIIFWDGTRKEIEKVTNYGSLTDHGVFYVDKDNSRSFILKDAVRFIGLKSHWEGDK